MTNKCILLLTMKIVVCYNIGALVNDINVSNDYMKYELVIFYGNNNNLLKYKLNFL